jgi:hypothetical protein
MLQYTSAHGARRRWTRMHSQSSRRIAHVFDFCRLRLLGCFAGVDTAVVEGALPMAAAPTRSLAHSIGVCFTADTDAGT